MNRIEDMLRDALAATPVPESTDRFAELDRRVRRARRRLAIGAAAVTAAVVAAVAIPLSAMSGGDGRADLDAADTPTPTRSAASDAPAFVGDVWLRSGALGVASGGATGTVFVVRQVGDGRSLVELDANGVEVDRVDVPESAHFVRYRDGIAWVWGGGDGAYPTPSVTAVLLGGGHADGRTSTLSLPDDSPVQDLAITESGDAWAVGVDEILQLRVVDGQVQVASEIPLVGARHIVVTPAGSLWVQADTRLVELLPRDPPTGVGADPGTEQDWAWPLLAPADANTIWTLLEPQYAVELDPEALDEGISSALIGARLSLDGSPSALVVDDSGGIFVALEGGGIDYFKPREEGPAYPRVKAYLEGVDVETMAAAPEGGVVFASFGQSLAYWRPGAR